MALIPAFHEVYGWQLIPESRQRLHPDEWSVYDPAAHNADDVVKYLAAAGPRERARVLALERDGKARKTVLAEDPETPVAVGAGEPTSPAGDDPGQNQED
ncbi:hypothetical protein [Blastococcus sp. CCUG 61487]|uniref:hypothetical protein n=1 Tax=Blastococcus sp. CCUG 61487 TaxID=1840703 RepID=UPI0010C0364E|nr:hypothetical protein [Blastococcus sp. CCUG 61487]TKJ24364.1 hypothetical protein A6V29_05035 [Blastococcus sp. CCUG 61487]